MSTDLERVLETHRMVVEDGYTRPGTLRYRNYAVSTLRGGVGKSTLAFNLAHELAGQRSLLVADVCAQCNLTEAMLGDTPHQVSVIDALQPMLLGPAFGTVPGDLSYRISQHCDSFKTQKPSWLVPGSAQMFAFPSTLYQQLQHANSQIANSRSSPNAVANLLESLKTVLEDQARQMGAEGILMDTSPFYAGGTHLAWCAADAVIIPVRVDEHSLDSLDLTLDMLSNPETDFLTWNARAGGRPAPRVAAVVMTMVGAKSQKRSTPDNASRMFIERAIDTVNRYPTLFDTAQPVDSVVVTDDFMSSGRISGAKSVPISQLRVKSFHTVDGRRLQVNSSVQRYQNQLAYLASVL